MPMIPASLLPVPTESCQLTLPQARVLACLRSKALLTRAKLAQRAGFSEVSGTVTRVLHGLREGSSSGAAHAGLLARGLIAAEEIEVEDGIRELAYSATQAGLAALDEWLEYADLPEHRSRVASTNKRYKGD